jgi:hypothetical protein
MATLILMTKAKPEQGPYHRVLPRDGRYAHPRCVIAGETRKDAVLYVHSQTPVLLPLTPHVVSFLLGALSELPARPAPDPLDAPAAGLC